MIIESLCGFLLSCNVASAHESATDAALEKQVGVLVKQLGDSSHRRREAAQKALIDAGEKILPILDAVSPAQELEVRVRLAKIRERLEPRDRLVLAWEPAVQLVEDTVSKQRMPILRGRVQLIAKQRQPEPREKEPLVVELFTKAADGGLVQRETWQFDPAILKKLGKCDATGRCFTLVLPWSSYQPDDTVVLKIRLGSLECKQEVSLMHSDELRSWHMMRQLRNLGAIPF
jgi:hypothetical protein